MEAVIYRCDHILYNDCTLFRDGNVGLAVIQQRHNPVLKTTWWSTLDKKLIKEIMDSPEFPEVFRAKSGVCKCGIYPTVEVRKLMYALKKKPIPKERWETKFY